MRFDRLNPPNHGVNPRGLRRVQPVKLGVRNDEFYLGVIDFHSQDPEEMEHSFLEFEDFEPVT